MKHHRIYFALWALVIAASNSGGIAANPGIKIVGERRFSFANGDFIEDCGVEEPIADLNVPYADRKTVIYERMTLHRSSGTTEVVYLTPSLPGAMEGTGNVLSIQALVDDRRLELIKFRSGVFDFFKFVRDGKMWRFEGHQYFDDLTSKNYGNPPHPEPKFFAKSVELADWSTLRLTMEDDSTRTLTIDNEGVVCEGGDPYVYIRASPVWYSGFANAVERSKWFYKHGDKDLYDEPRDANGVPKSVVEHYRQRNSQAAGHGDPSGNGATPHEMSNAPSSTTAPPNQTQPSEQPASNAQLGSSPKHWIPFATVIIAGVVALVFWMRHRRS